MSNQFIRPLIAAATLAGLLSLSMPSIAQDNQAMSMSELLRQVEQGRVNDSKEYKAREQKFSQAKSEQQKLLNAANREKDREEARSQRLESEFEANDIQIAEYTATLNQRLGSLKELFGVMQQVSGDSQVRFDNSLTNIQYPDRGKFLEALAKKIGGSAQLPSLDEIERLWFELQREMTESGKIVRLSTNVIMADGAEQQMEVVRVGLFNIITDGKYLKFEPQTGNVSELPRQPEQGRYINSTTELFNASSGLVHFGLDPTLGGVLNSLIARPNLKERVQQGGLVGYLIIALGCIGLLIAFERMFVLGLASRKVTAQLNSDSPSQDNALGRVLSVAEGNRGADTETLELKLSEAIFKETPALNRALLFLKIISVVAPLMGLLGTVTGMINTFQAITLYGTGDPKLMAGGISQALVTTVLGLTVAIPMVLLHTLVSGRSRRIVQVLQEQSAGIIATHAEERSHDATGRQKPAQA
ncbi:MAG TPA: MotA/TolQ/ExbB proton channel family protein [Gammaproteobacteria bacterium]|jgi:biopolymer transport protein ExbB|nr:energy transducer TonB [Chromatiales bacterium]MCP4926063.1 energy transducer TonB [Gammaproteobacteria bacterium]HJP39917.1 MotA/TolQ/ExbB proton channel family protein [Gammaproteobacteria bacterium]